jgi:hypothetical protein
LRRRARGKTHFGARAAYATESASWTLRRPVDTRPSDEQPTGRFATPSGTHGSPGDGGSEGPDRSTAWYLRRGVLLVLAGAALGVTGYVLVPTAAEKPNRPGVEDRAPGGRTSKSGETARASSDRDLGRPTKADRRLPVRGGRHRSPVAGAASTATQATTAANTALATTAPEELTSTMPETTSQTSPVATTTSPPTTPATTTQASTSSTTTTTTATTTTTTSSAIPRAEP